MNEETKYETPPFDRPEARQPNRSVDINELAAALAKAQGQMGGALKSSENPFFKSSYADLASVWDACREPLSNNGLSVIQIPGRLVGEKGVAVIVETVLAHTSGQWISCKLAATSKDPGPQALGSVITYLRRYGLAAMVGVAQVDDDAEASEGRQFKSEKPPLSAEQIDEIVSLMEGEGLGKEEIRKWLGRLAKRFGVANHSQIPEASFDQAKSIIVDALLKLEEKNETAN